MNSASFPPCLELRCGPVTAVDLALYAAASGDHNPLHLDEQQSRRAGFDDPLVHGMLSMAYVGRLFTDAFGPSALVSLQTRFTGTAARGSTLTIRAELAEHDLQSARYSVTAKSDAGTDVITGSATIGKRGETPVGP
jgi:acyl dehydratase